MTRDELEVLRIAGQVYAALLRPEHTTAERALLRFQAASDAAALREHVLAMDIHNMAVEDKIQVFLAALEKNRGNLSKTARELSVCQRTAMEWRNQFAPQLRRMNIKPSAMAASAK